MSSLKKIKDRLHSIRSTRQITASMKVVAVSRLKKKHDAFLKTVPFADEMNRVVRRLVRSIKLRQENLDWNNQDKIIKLPRLVNGNAEENKFLVVVLTSDDGLSGASLLQVIAHARKLIDYLLSNGKEVRIFFYGSKGDTLLKKRYPDIPITAIRRKNNKNPYLMAERLTAGVIEAFYGGRFDVCLTVYNQFKSVVVQTPIVEQLIPDKLFLKDNPWDFLNRMDQVDYRQQNALGQQQIKLKKSSFLSALGGADMLAPLKGSVFKTDLESGRRSPDVYDYEPTDIGILESVLSQHLTAYIYRIMLESEVSDNAARLMAMDNATRNAGEMLEDLNQVFRRMRQTKITTDIAEVSVGISQENLI